MNLSDGRFDFADREFFTECIGECFLHQRCVFRDGMGDDLADLALIESVGKWVDRVQALLSFGGLLTVQPSNVRVVHLEPSADEFALEGTCVLALPTERFDRVVGDLQGVRILERYDDDGLTIGLISVD